MARLSKDQLAVALFHLIPSIDMKLVLELDAETLKCWQKVHHAEQSHTINHTFLLNRIIETPAFAP